MGYFDFGQYDGDKLLKNKPWNYFSAGRFGESGLPPLPSLPAGFTGAGGAQTQTENLYQLQTATQPSDIGVQPSIPAAPPPPPPLPPANLYQQKAEDYRTVQNTLNTFAPTIQGLNREWRNVVNAWRTYQSGDIARRNPAAAAAANRAYQTFINQTLPATLQPIQDTLASYGFNLNLGDLDPFAQGDMANLENLLTVTSATGDLPATLTVSDAINWLGGEVGRLEGAATRQGTFEDFLGGFEEWATNYEAGQTQVDPFADPNGWGQIIRDIYGETEVLPDIQDLLMSLHDLMPVWQYSADALPNLSAPERVAKFFDDLKNAGFDMGTMEGTASETLMKFLYEKAQELAPERMFEQLGLDYTKWEQMTAPQIAELTKMIGRKSVFDDKDMRKYIDVKMRRIKRVNKEEYNRHLDVLAEKGIAYGGSVVRSAAELYSRLGEAEANATAEVFMEGIKLAEQGKWEAMKYWGAISDTQAELLMNMGGLKATLFGQYFDFLGDVGRVAASEFQTRSDLFVTEATLKLKYELGVAGLEIDKYISDRGLDLEGLKLAYDNYWRDRGADLAEKAAEFDAAIGRWQTASDMANMINEGRTDRLMQMADLALKAQSGDMEAWGMYQQLALREQLENRGMDIDQAMGLADLTWRYYQLGETLDFQRWATQYDGLLRQELLRMNIQGQKELLELKAELEDDGFWGSIMKMVGGVTRLGIVLNAAGLFGGEESEEGGGYAS